MAINIRLVGQGSDYQKALEFINKVAFNHYKCQPPPPPDVLFVATNGSEIVGTTGLDIGEVNKPLPLEIIYEFDKAKTPWPFHREKNIQYGRWMVTMRGIADALIYVAAKHGLTQGKTHTISEAKDHIKAKLDQLGIDARVILDARLMMDRISKDGLGYYLDLPAPKLYMMDLSQMVEAMEPNVRRSVKAGFIVFGP
ncbi:MAG: hypothetical protein G01um10143_582 [Parcubacteria group bacterium Gr01-1014_3]|nr:MAG: hypothetical protein G01um10143_582 [Parcubacteria group bacterium Gr01-1014_3]